MFIPTPIKFFGMDQLLCLGHFYNNLIKHEYAYQGKLLLESATDFEFNKIKNVYIMKKDSMNEKLLYEMPSTKNSLESSHVHINSKTPRNNKLFSVNRNNF